MSVNPEEMRWLVGGMIGDLTGRRANAERLDALNRIAADLAQPESFANRYLDALQLFAEEAWNVDWAAIFEDERAEEVGNGSPHERTATTIRSESQTLWPAPGERSHAAAAWLSAEPDDLHASAVLLLAVRDALSELAIAEGSPKELSNRALVNLVRDRLFGNRPIAMRRQRGFYVTAARAVAHLIVQRAERRLSEKAASHSETDVTARESTFALAEAAPLRTLARSRALERLSAVEPRLAEIYFLSEFAGRNSQEISELIGEPLSDVEADLETATVEVCLGEL